MPFILVATFTMPNLFIAIIVNAMQSFTLKEQEQTAAAVEQVRVHIEVDLNAEMRGLREEIRDLKSMLTPGYPTQAAATQQTSPT